MASRSVLTITVTKSSAQSKITIRSKGKYASLPTNGTAIYLDSQPLLTTASEQAYWEAVLALVTSAVES